MRLRTVIVVLVTIFGISCGSLPTAEDKQVASSPYLFSKITFEIVPITSNQKPSPRALKRFRKRLDENMVCRADQIHFVVRPAVGWGVNDTVPWQIGTVTGFEATHRKLTDDDPEDRTLRVFVSYIDGPYLNSDGMRWLGGLQYSDTSFAIFKHGAGGREASVLLHEFGHMIGLVKDESRPNHDAEHEHHCVNRDCAMFHSAPGRNADLGLYCKQELADLIRDRRSP